MVYLFVKHTTCCLGTADLDPGTDKDYINALDKLIPKLKFNHPHDPGHFDDHINSTLIGPGLLLPFRNKRLELGSWQVPVLIELSGPRQRSIMVQFL